MLDFSDHTKLSAVEGCCKCFGNMGCPFPWPGACSWDDLSIDQCTLALQCTVNFFPEVACIIKISSSHQASSNSPKLPAQHLTACFRTDSDSTAPCIMIAIFPSYPTSQTISLPCCQNSIPILREVFLSSCVDLDVVYEQERHGILR